MKISRVRLWKDCGFTEGGTRIPAIGSALPAADYDSQTTHPGVEWHPESREVFTSIKFEGAFPDLFNISYIEATYEYNDGRTQLFYGWVHGCEVISDNPDHPVTRLVWVTDEWRTFNAFLVFRRGYVARRPFKLRRQTFEPDLWLHTDVQSLVSSHIHWVDNVKYYPPLYVILTYTDEDQNHQVTSTKTFFFPVSGYRPQDNIAVSDDLGNSAVSLSLSSVLTGEFDEKLGLLPERIKGIWISPISPCEFTTDQKYQTYSIWPGATWILETHTDASSSTVYGYYRLIPDSLTMETYAEFEISLTPFTPTETARYVLTGFNREIVGEFPYGLITPKLNARVVITTTSAYIQYRVPTIQYQQGYYGPEYAYAEGRCFTVPLPTIEVTENSWSTYLYTGQREYDRNALNLQSAKAMVGSVIEGASQAASGAAMSVVNPVGGLSATAAGAAHVGAAVAYYAVDQMVFIPEQNRMNDAIHAKQSDGLLMSGSSIPDILRCGDFWMSIVKLEPNGEALGRYVNNNNAIGYEYGGYLDSTDLTTLIAAGGPMQISQLEIGGNIPPRSKQIISQMFGKGVYIV